MKVGSLEGQCVFKIEPTRTNRWKTIRYDLTWGYDGRTVFTMTRMGYFDTPGQARGKKTKFINENNLKKTGEIRTFGLTRLQLYAAAP